MKSLGLGGVLALVLVLGGCGGKKKQAEAEVELEVLDPSVVEELSVEARQLEKIQKGLKVMFYKKTRAGVLKTALGVIGSVEGNAGHPLLEKLPVEVREMITAAGGEAANLKSMAEEPPAEVGLLIATGYLVHLQKTPALYELQLIDPETFSTPGGRAGFHVVRGVTFFMHGLKQHGLQDLRKANVGSAEDLPEEVRTAMFLGAAAAAIAADEPRMARTQLEMAEELTPGDPTIVFLRAEQAISKQRFDEAALLLEEWREENPKAEGVVAEVIDKRMAALGEEDDRLTTVLVEPRWLIQFGLDYISEKAGTSEAFRKVDEVTGGAQGLIDDLLEKASGLGL